MANMVTVTISEEGDLTFLAGNRLADDLAQQGDTTKRRASHVEPVDFAHRAAFKALRWAFGDKGWMAGWTRTWRCLWRVNTAPVGGPILTWGHVPDYIAEYQSITWIKRTIPHQVALWSDRGQAIDAEVAFLNRWFLERQ